MNDASLSMGVRPLQTFLATAWLRGPRRSLADPISTAETARFVQLGGRLGGSGTAIPRAATLLVVLVAASHAPTPAQLCPRRTRGLVATALALNAHDQVVGYAFDHSTAFVERAFLYDARFDPPIQDLNDLIPADSDIVLNGPPESTTMGSSSATEQWTDSSMPSC